MGQTNSIEPMLYQPKMSVLDVATIKVLKDEYFKQHLVLLSDEEVIKIVNDYSLLNNLPLNKNVGKSFVIE